jgi:hypothetical protein
MQPHLGHAAVLNNRHKLRAWQAAALFPATLSTVMLTSSKVKLAYPDLQVALMLWIGQRC